VHTQNPAYAQCSRRRPGLQHGGALPAPASAPDPHAGAAVPMRFFESTILRNGKRAHNIWKSVIRVACLTAIRDSAFRRSEFHRACLPGKKFPRKPKPGGKVPGPAFHDLAQWFPDKRIRGLAGGGLAAAPDDYPKEVCLVREPWSPGTRCRSMPTLLRRVVDGWRCVGSSGFPSWQGAFWQQVIPAAHVYAAHREENRVFEIPLLCVPVWTSRCGRGMPGDELCVVSDTIGSENRLSREDVLCIGMWTCGILGERMLPMITWPQAFFRGPQSGHPQSGHSTRRGILERNRSNSMILCVRRNRYACSLPGRNE